MKAKKIVKLRNTKHLLELLILTAILVFSSVMLWQDFSDMKKSEDAFAVLEKIAETTVSGSDDTSEISDTRKRNISALSTCYGSSKNGRFLVIATREAEQNGFV